MAGATPRRPSCSVFLFMEHLRSARKTSPALRKTSRHDWENGQYLNPTPPPPPCFHIPVFFVDPNAVLFSNHSCSMWMCRRWRVDLRHQMIPVGMGVCVCAGGEDSLYLYSCRREIPNKGNSNTSHDTLNPTTGGPHRLASTPVQDVFF